MRRLVKWIAPSALVFWLAAFACAQPNDHDEPFLIREVIYGHKAGMALTYDLIHPQNGGNKAAVVFVVSGGWNSRYIPPERFRLNPMVRSLSEAGYHLILLRHGSAPRFKVPEAVADVRLALRHLHMNADEYGFEKNRIGIFGASAGGHLSLMMGTTGDDGSGDRSEIEDQPCRVACVVAYFPPTDLRDMVGPSSRFPALNFDQDESDDVSPILHVTKDDAPTLLVHGTEDRLVPIEHSKNLKSEFDQTGVACELLVLDGARHGFRGEQAKRATEALLGWFDRHLLGQSE